MDKTNIANLSEEERDLDTRVIEIDGMTSDECVQIIKNALGGVDGVKKVIVNRHNRRVTVTFDTTKTNMPEIHDTLLRHGYHPTRFAES